MFLFICFVFVVFSLISNLFYFLNPKWYIYEMLTSCLEFALHLWPLFMRQLNGVLFVCPLNVLNWGHLEQDRKIKANGCCSYILSYCEQLLKRFRKFMYYTNTSLKKRCKEDLNSMFSSVYDALWNSRQTIWLCGIYLLIK